MTQFFLLSTGILLAVMPWTEHFYTGDSFRGGQDIEFGLLGIAAAFGLGLLLPSVTKLRIEGCFALIEQLCLRVSRALRNPGLPPIERTCYPAYQQRCSPPGVLRNMPLQI